MKKQHTIHADHDHCPHCQATYIPSLFAADLVVCPKCAGEITLQQKAAA